MKFKHGTRRKAVEYEKAIEKYWKDNKIFEKSVEQRPADNSYVFYDGPPFITGVPHYGTLLSSIVKDAVPRYQTMRGKRVERRWGWDCHGLPAENFTEKHLNGTVSRVAGSNKLQLKSGDETREIMLEEYITTARDLMVANSATWENVIDRVGRWVDFQGAYRTMDKDFMESVWWAFAELYKKGKIYEGEKVLMYDTKFATPVSKAEVTMDNDAYQTVTDPSVFVKFKMIPGQKCHNGERETHEDIYLLAWTTTPWTLPANMALAVNPKMKYVEAEVDGENLILAKDLAEKVLAGTSYKIIREMSGEKLIGMQYIPLFPEENASDSSKNTHRIYAADFVEDEGGTGIVHIAPAYGEDDFALAQANNIPVRHAIDDNGYYFPDFAEKLHSIGVRDTDERGIEVWAANKFIAKRLEDVGKVWKIDYIQHEYPFNPRSKQRIMYRAIKTWFMDIQGQKELMLAKNQNINWFPPHIKDGRFAKNIDQAPDWALSRNRFWATAMPVWKGDRGTVKVIGSYEELEKLSGVKLDDYHRPWVDEITFEIDGEHFTRVEEVLDGWFESGSMPFAQFHYPFENKEKFEKNYPADFIVEYIAQVRAWFYYVHAINTALFGENAFQNCIVTGTLAGNDGRKMSKSLGNYTDPNELMDKYSADALRFLLLSSPLMNGEDFALNDKDVGDVARKLNMVWNMYDFFTMYAEVDGWEFDGNFAELDKLKNPLDQWIISRLHQLKSQITKGMDEYNFPEALGGVMLFIDDASNWYVRRSRRRFWKSEDDADKNDAYKTLYTVLEQLAIILAPFTPFLSEELWHKLIDENSSVHLEYWPPVGSTNEEVLDNMKRTREIIEKGLAQRMDRNDEFGQIKVRQPLAQLTYAGEKLDDFYEQIIAEEVNVKEVKQGKDLVLDKKITPELRREGQAREIIRVVQKARKDAGLNVDDRIVVDITTNDKDLQKTLNEHKTIIMTEVLATESAENDGYEVVAKIDDAEIKVQLNKES